MLCNVEMNDPTAVVCNHWDLRHQYDRLHLIANQSRFLILPEHRHRNLASRVLSICRRRIQADWQARFGFPVLALETLVDP